MTKDFWRAAKLLLVQLLKLDINEQLVWETGQSAGEVSQFECLRGTLGEIGEKEIIDRQVMFGKKAPSHSLKEYVAHFSPRT